MQEKIESLTKFTTENKYSVDIKLSDLTALVVKRVTPDQLQEGLKHISALESNACTSRNDKKMKELQKQIEELKGIHAEIDIQKTALSRLSESLQKKLEQQGVPVIQEVVI